MLTLSLVFLSFFALQRASAEVFYIQQAQSPDRARLNLEAFTGSTSFSAEGSVMMPILADPNRVFYADIQESYDSNSKGNSTDMGLGYREIKDLRIGNYFNQQVILGGYFFADRTESKGEYDNRSYWQGNLGGEVYNKNFSLSLNAYFALGPHKWSNGTKWANQIGDYSHEVFDKNSEYDTKYRLDDIASDWGFDIDMGHVIPLSGIKGLSIPNEKTLKGYFGFYYYNQEEGYNLTHKKQLGSVIGVSLKASYKLDNYLTLDVRDTYDNYNDNTFLLGLMLSIGGTINEGMDSTALTENLLAPVDHNIGEASALGSSQELSSVRSQIVSGSKTVDDKGHLFEQMKHIYFFSDDGSSDADGTYSHPYSLSQLNNSTLKSIESAFPDYSYIYVTGKDVNIGKLVLNKNQSLEGRFGEDSGFEMPADINDLDKMPTLDGQLVLLGGSLEHSQIVTGIKMHNTGVSGVAAIQVGEGSDEALNVNINNLQIGQGTDSLNGKNYADGISITNANVSGISSNIIYAQNNGIVINSGTVDSISVNTDEKIVAGNIAIVNAGGVTQIVDDGTINGNLYSILNEGTGKINNITTSSGSDMQGGIFSIKNIAGGNIQEINNLGTIFGIDNAGNIGNIEDEGLIKGSEYGIKNSGTIKSIIGGSLNFPEGSIVGATSGIYNTVSGIISGDINYLEDIKGNSYGIENDNKIDGAINISQGASISGNISIENNESGYIGGISNAGTVGEIEDEGSISGETYGIENTGTIGSIVGAPSTSKYAKGVILGQETGIYNLGTINGDISNLKEISGSGDGWGIYNENDINGSINVISSEQSNTNISSIENTGTIDGISNAGKIGNIEEGEQGSIIGQKYGIENSGTIGSITGGTPDSHSGVIQGESAGIYNIGTIENISYLSKIEGTGTGTNVYGIYSSGQITGNIEGNIRIDVPNTENGMGINIANTNLQVLGVSTISVPQNGMVEGIDIAGTAGSIENSGEIEDNETGVSAITVSGSLSQSIDNSGEILGNQYGIYVSSAEANLGQVVNNAGATIEGGKQNDIAIDNEGTIEGIENKSDPIGDTLGVGNIENIGTILGSDYGIKNSGTMGSITGGTSASSTSGTIEGGTAGIYNTGTLGDISYLSNISGISTAVTAYGIYNSGTLGNIIGNTITGEGASVTSAYGIYISGGQTGDIQSNTFSNVYTGIDIVSGKVANLSALQGSSAENVFNGVTVSFKTKQSGL